MLEPCQIPDHQDATHEGVCWKCGAESRRLEAVAKFQAGRERQILELLWDEGDGLQNREASAELQKIPGPLLQAIPAKFRGGSLEDGFGIGGGTGIGKTQAIASVLVDVLGQWAERVIVPSIRDEYGQRKRFPSIRWSCWPDEVHWLRAHAINGAEDRVERLATARVLVLDDLGRERIKGDYSSDWGASQLDHIVNTRYRAELPIIWTTNVRQTDLVGLYGAANIALGHGQTCPAYSGNGPPLGLGQCLEDGSKESHLMPLGDRCILRPLVEGSTNLRTHGMFNGRIVPRTPIDTKTPQAQRLRGS